MDLKKRLGRAERALLKIDQMYNDNENASRIVGEYFNENLKGQKLDTDHDSGSLAPCPFCGSPGELLEWLVIIF